MLLTESEKAKQVRSIILDIVIATINERVGGGTKYINRRDAYNEKGDIKLTVQEAGDSQTMRHHRLFLHGRHGTDGNRILVRRQTAGVLQIRLHVLHRQRELPDTAR